MKSKDILKNGLTEADDIGGTADRPSQQLAPRRPRAHAPGQFGPPGADFPENDEEMDDPGMHRGLIGRVTGRPPGPPAQFNPREVSQLKDVLILTLAKLAGSEMDERIGMALATGQTIEPGLLQHILDEARNANIPPTHHALLQKIYTQVNAGR